MVMPVGDGHTLVKVQGWYDNEWGYAHRLVDLVAVVGDPGAPGAPGAPSTAGAG
jgi:hypothetical protein